MASLSVVLKGRWLWLMLTLINVASSQQRCPNNCLQCDLNKICLKCIDGYFGQRCHLQCDQLCRNGKCRIDGSCLDIVERAIWKIRRMRRNTPANCHDAECTCCKSNFRGSNCQESCPNCRTRYISGECNRYCEAGFYGDTCEENCPENCAPGNAGKPLCQKTTSECSNNCKQGFFGKICNQICPSGCKDGICLPSGSCVKCNGTAYGVTCNKTCHGCKGGCYKNGTCMQGCKDDFYGPGCNLRCGTDCSKDGMCHLYKDQIHVCSTTCKYIQASENAAEDCIAVQSSLNAETSVAAIVVPVVIIIIIIIVIVIILILWRKALCCFRTPGEANAATEPFITNRTPGEANAATEPLITNSGTDDVAQGGHDDTHDIKSEDDEPKEETNVKLIETPKEDRMRAGPPIKKRNVKPNDTPNKDRIEDDEPKEETTVKLNETPEEDRMPAVPPIKKRNVKPNDTPNKDRIEDDKPTEETNDKPNETPEEDSRKRKEMDDMPSVKNMVAFYSQRN